ncbi:relaxin receptor 1 [Parasteatoda tepidariorum]|uniref:relaxin receptor 1 n=1 Tax=Parasteatoda tepidariorum TaxID=114398 RepID=UPI0039BCE7AF
MAYDGKSMRVATIKLILFFWAIDPESTTATFKKQLSLSRETAGQFKCEAEEFPCGNTSVCLERVKHCDGIKHCPNGEDEQGCADAHGSLNSLLKGMKQYPELQDAILDGSFDNCSLDYIPDYCECIQFTSLYCGSKNLTSLPRGIGKHVTKLVLMNSSLQHLSREAFSMYIGLKIIHIEGNNIPILNSGLFLRLTNVTVLVLMRNQIKYIQLGAFSGLVNLRWLFLQSNSLELLDMNVFSDLMYLEVLDLNDNRLKKLDVFPPLRKLYYLSIERNNLERIGGSTFQNLVSLEVLSLKNNVLRFVEETSFDRLNNLLELDISYNLLTYLKPKLFFGLRNLNKLNIEFNMIKSLSATTFKGLHLLKSLDLRGLEIKNIDIQLFYPLTSLEFIYFKKFLYCSYVPYVRICIPKTDGLSSTEHLLVWPALRMSVWIVALMTCIGNTVVLSWRALSRKEDEILSLLIKNLAFADLLMGIYLIAIGAQDVSFRDKYNEYAHGWMSSWHCTTCGIVAMGSSEVSVLILSLITFERYRCIRSNIRVITISGARNILGVIWAVGFTLAILPAFNWYDEQGFYTSNGLCFPLHIDDPFMLGWQYSAFVFFGINFPAVVLIIILYGNMFSLIKHNRGSARPVNLSQNEDTILAIRFFFIVLTDCLCWIPIVVIKMLALTGINISHTLYACVVVFILPINSALNPLLYTIAAPTELRRQIERWLEPTLQWMQRFNFAIKSRVKVSSTLSRSERNLENRTVPQVKITDEHTELCITTI